MRATYIIGLFLAFSVVEVSAAEEKHYYTLKYLVNVKFDDRWEDLQNPEFTRFAGPHVKVGKDVAINAGRVSGTELSDNEVECVVKDVRSAPNDQTEVEIEITCPARFDASNLPTPDQMVSTLADFARENTGLNIVVEEVQVSEHPTENTAVKSLQYLVGCSVIGNVSDPNIEQKIKDMCTTQCQGFDQFLSCTVRDVSQFTTENVTAEVVVSFGTAHNKNEVEAALNTVNMLVNSIRPGVFPLATGSTTQKPSSTSSDSTGVLSHKISLPSMLGLIALSWWMTGQHSR